MGIDIWNLRFLLEARDRVGTFGDFLQIGRQELHIPESAYGVADALLREHGIDLLYRDATRGGRYADEGLFETLGATTVSAADASAYEGASIVHDFNDPIPGDLHQRFDTIFDGGSLEHIFNIPMTLSNEMNLLKIGGTLLTSVPSNNWLGHGFYQFSPELPYRVFTPSNGFRVHGVFLSEYGGGDRLYEVEDLARRAGGEIGTTHTNTSMMFIATKTAHVVPFRRWPQQGDYSSAWEEHEPGHAPGDAPDHADVSSSPTAVAPSPPSGFAKAKRWLGLAG